MPVFPARGMGIPAKTFPPQGVLRDVLHHAAIADPPKPAILHGAEGRQHPVDVVEGRADGSRVIRADPVV